jgi:cystathionine beta-lyase/cystathionine gamma-synthase
MDEVLRFDSLAVHAGVHLTNAVAQLEARVAALEGSALGGRGAPATAVAFTSGRAALDAVARLLRPGDGVLVSFEVSGVAARIFSGLAEFEVTVEFADLSDDVERIAAANPSLVYLETPSSATLRVPDIARVARAAHDAGAILVVDNALLGAGACRPLEFGADAVVYTGAGALTGDAGLPLGIVVTRNDDVLERVRAQRDVSGTRLNAQTAGSALRGLKTLGVRLNAQSRTASALATRFAGHDHLRELHYPSLRDSARVETQQRTRDGRELGGALIAVELWSADAARAFQERLALFTLGEWAGGTDSTVCQPARSSHRALSEFDLALPDALVRLSVGLEDERDLANALEAALAAVAEFTPPPVPVEPDEPEGAPQVLEVAPSDLLETLLETLDEPALERFDRLRAWRDETAREQGISKLLVLTNAVLARIAAQSPTTLEDLAAVPGIGPRKLERYGEALLEVLAQDAQGWAARLDLSQVLEATAPRAAKPEPVAAKKRRRRKRAKPGAGA